MTRWFDVNEFLPGKDAAYVLISYKLGGEHYRSFYNIASFKDGDWFAKDDYLIEDDLTKVTHWAFIEEPI